VLVVLIHLGTNLTTRTPAALIHRRFVVDRMSRGVERVLSTRVNFDVRGFGCPVHSAPHHRSRVHIHPALGR
jgi:hypothetical protein